MKELEAIVALDGLSADEYGCADGHEEADAILLAFVPEAVRAAYKRAENRLGSGTPIEDPNDPENSDIYVGRWWYA